MNMIETYAYIAGLMDADGWITLRRNNVGTKWEGVSHLVGIVNRDKEVLDWCQSIFGGKVYSRKRGTRQKKTAKNWQPVFDWVPTADCVDRVLECLLPYLRIKKRQGEIVLEFLSSRQDRKKEYRLPESVRVRRTKLLSEIQKLNHVGLV